MCGCSILFAVYEVVFSKWESVHEKQLVEKNPHRQHGDSCARVVDTLVTVALMGLSNLVRCAQIPTVYLLAHVAEMACELTAFFAA